MDVACSDQAEKAEVVFRQVTGKRGMGSALHLPKGSDYSIETVKGLMSGLGLNQIKMVPPGVPSPWRFACKIAHFGGDVLQAMETLSADARLFYDKELFPDSTVIGKQPPGSEKNVFQQNPR
ncbi:MAG: hypothetical protein UX02_C0002G0058 [Candidatus Moranbacteria bacterium GW2011_GWC1_45_18]|nr:MAG: hypothetical protein UT79_C0001G0403 [Candidatus Moranbacteria bacterium GW2011_GWC2_40_12]KKT32357.1 MAG: hypothetical protein UW19_C0023G0011 [Candidatus Moranbacteria bacterium GW2011_GWF2_44_10]KKT99739.1 MAG: hypothetical protein UX02_C0002G0058 [Candidatus Moranbacteria bacterium GW2011_GWC1_45_18]OGI36908.1 MAG: hypothetical protein A2407_01905 [Candidatus Moranbacteria bacterium RIFOXYC1_FULL_44_8]OGI39482.1 MAG: hypothetical protein A2374_03075 [Candidatus Moranbacteria bacteri